MIGDITERFGEFRAKVFAFKTYLITALVCLAIGFGLGILLSLHGGTKQPAPLASIDSQVPKHDVQLKAPLKALNKAALRKRLKVIAEQTAKDMDKEVLATATIEDDSGTLYAGAVLDTGTGATEIVGHRPFAEALKNNRIGIGVGIGEDGIEKAVLYENTFFRIKDVFGSAMFEFSRPGDHRSRWSVMVWATYHF